MIDKRLQTRIEREGEYGGNLRAFIDNFVNGITVPGSTYWNVGLAGTAGAHDADQDEEGMQTVENFANNLAHVIKKIYA